MNLHRSAIRFLAVAAVIAAASTPIHAATRETPAKSPASSVRVAKPAPAAREQRSAAALPATRGERRVAFVQRRPLVPLPPPRLSFGQIGGLHEVDDPLELKSSVALVMDQDTDEVIFSKNPGAVLPIASITKLMTALVVTQAAQSLDDVLTITEEDIDTEKNSSSRLKPGTQLTRGEMLHLALMSSENRAAHALGRYYPGGLATFVSAMNARAHLLGMSDTRYVEPTGLSSSNQSSAHDLALLVKAAHSVPLIRELSTSPEYQVSVGSRQLQYHTTNRLVLNPNWDIGVQKTGYISEAGQCLVMQAKLFGRQLIMVLLDSAGRYSRIGDAERIRKWLGDHAPSLAALPLSALPVPAAAALTAAPTATLPAAGGTAATVNPAGPSRL